MRVLVTGKEGQVARCLADNAADYPQLELIFAAREGTDIRIDLADDESVRSAVHKIRPDVIINAAAYTGVDAAEDEPDLAMQINGLAPGILASQASAIGARIIHISTDYVFDGELDRPYLIGDPVNPIGVYGRTKLVGEQAVRAQNPHHVIVRTAWVYSPYGKNFYKTMRHLADTRDEISVVADQLGNPTSGYSIADGILKICDAWRAGRDDYLGETHHLVDRESMSWYDFACKIVEEHSQVSGRQCHVRAITTADYPTRARRPKNSRLVRSLP